MGYGWPEWALNALRGIEPYEVMQALASLRRWPRWAADPHGLQVLTIWARSSTGRPLIVAVRQVEHFDWQILGAREMEPAEVVEFTEWEEARDDD